MENLTREAESFKTLIVEDNESFRRVLKDLLNRHFGFMALEEACDGREAMEKIGHCDADLVFMDIKLPDENGLHLTKTFKQKCPRLPVIILTSYDYPEYRQAAKESGASHFIAKESVGEKGFLDTIRSILDVRTRHH